MTGKPADSQNSIQRIEARIALMEGALQGCYFTPDGSLRVQTGSLQSLADALFDDIRDMKVALYYVKNGIPCPECMTADTPAGNFCPGCGLKFEA